MTTLVQTLIILFFNSASAAPMDTKMSPIIDEYLKIQKSLAADSLDGVSASAKNIETQAPKLSGKTTSGKFKDLPNQLKTSAQAIATAKDVKEARKGFKQLSESLVAWSKVNHPEGITIVYCSMAKARWLQKTKDIHNPYYGKEMEECGEIEN